MYTCTCDILNTQNNYAGAWNYAPAGAISTYVTMFSNVVCCSRR